jgi:hypothetical protein
MAKDIHSFVRGGHPLRSFVGRFIFPSVLAAGILTFGTVFWAAAQDESGSVSNPAEALTEARATAAQLSATVDSVRSQFQQAQKAGDPIKAVCLDDKLTQLEDASSAVSSRLSSLQEAVSAGDTAAIAQNVSVMQALGQSAANLSASAKQCIGEEKAEVEVSDSLNVLVDSNIVQADVIQGGSLNVASAAAAGTVQAETPVAPEPPPDDMMRGPIDVSPNN